MELKQLQYFVVSVDAGSISKAAEILYTTQPHVSKTIKRMEKNMGMDLLKRGKKGVVMTKNGEKVYEQAQKILKSMQEIQRIQGKEEGSLLRLTSMPSNLLAGLFASFYQQEKKVRAKYLTGSLEMVLNQLCHRHADIGFVFISEYQAQGFKSIISYKRLEFELLQETRLVLFAGPKHPYYNKISVPGRKCRRFGMCRMWKRRYHCFIIQDILKKESWIQRQFPIRSAYVPTMR